MAGINAEAEQREQLITDIKQQIEKARDIDERMRKLRERRAGGRTPGNDGTDAGRTGSERPDNSGTEQAAKQIADLEREIEPVSYTHLEQSGFVERFPELSLFFKAYSCLLYTSRCV